ncbi:unnamed protein product [Alopecurus aequalis]
MRKCIFLLVTIAAMIYAITTPVAGCGESYGKKEWVIGAEDGWQPIKDINDKHIQEVGSWAVSEFLKHANCVLKFNKVVSGKENVVSDLKYELVIDASDISGKHGKYKAVVYEQGLTSILKLISFTKAN